MQFIPVPQCASFELVYECLGQRIENVFHVHSGLDWTEAELTEECAIFRTWYTSHMQANVPEELVLALIIGKDMSSQTGPAVEYTIGLPVQGGLGAGTILPLNVTNAIKFNTPLRGRSYRGRSYWPATNAGEVSGNHLVEGRRAVRSAVMGELIAHITQDNKTLVVVSKFHNKMPRSTGIFTPVTSVSCDINMDSQRRRLAGRGQ